MIYILEFEKKLGNPANKRGQAKYYVGFCEDGRLKERLAEHEKGFGAAITAAAVRRGIAFSVVATLPGDRDRERQIKRWKNTPKLVERIRRGSFQVYQ